VFGTTGLKILEIRKIYQILLDAGAAKESTSLIYNAAYIETSCQDRNGGYMLARTGSNELE
jgi:hypothetical protein